MEELIFFGILIAFSILDAIARKKKRQQGGGARIPTPEEWEEDEWVDDDLPTYDADPSYDDGTEDPDGIPGEPLPRYAKPYGAGRREERLAGPARPKGPSSSEGMVPSDIWEEIEALARGEARTPPPPSPTRPAPGSQSEPGRGPAPPPKAEEMHPVHRTHPGLGKPISQRTGVGRVEDVTPGPTLGPQARKARRLVMRGGVSLRQAVLMREVLGPPVAFRDDPFFRGR